MIRNRRAQAQFCVFLFSMVMLFPYPAWGAENKSTAGLSVTAGSALLMDVESGDVLFEKNGYEKRPPASTTKMLTAILGLELGHPGEIVTVSSKAAAVGQATLHLDPGEKIMLYELITGALLHSGNDACVAIGEHIAGSEEKFVELMNTKAKLIGAVNTHFINTNGLPNKDHYSTAYDLALIARYGLKNPSFASITRQKETEIRFLEPDVMMDLRNTNKLLWSYPYADGVKTGTTTAAGKCLVASATKDGRQLVAVVLHAADRFGDAKKLLDWGFGQTQLVKIAQAGQSMAKFPLDNGQAVDVFTPLPLEVNIPVKDVSKLSFQVVWSKEKNLTIKAGEQLGLGEVILDNKVIKKVPLLSEMDVEQKTSLWSLFK